MSGDLATISVQDSRVRAKARPQARLLVVWPAELAQETPLGPVDVSIGRTSDSVLTLEHPTVSRAHATISWNTRTSRHVLTDLGSRNGVWAGGGRLAGATDLEHGTPIRLGDVLAVYESGFFPGGDRAGDAATIPGNSLAALELREEIARAAKNPGAALIVGETGVGKEGIARELHRLSDRPGEFVAVNCAALSSQLVESQLFGHIKGAFTGADTNRDGLFRSADTGTLVLDEIGELPIDLQPKLLRVLQEREVVPVGGARPTPVDVRVIAATNRQLSQEVEQGKFRRDLYARLAVWEIPAPPVRERRADVVIWLGLFAARFSDVTGQPVEIQWESAALYELLCHEWPNNLRDLDRLVHWAATRPGRVVAAADFPAWLAKPAEDVSDHRRAPVTQAPGREELLVVLEKNAWSVAATARHFQRDRKQVYRWLASFDIELPR